MPRCREDVTLPEDRDKDHRTAVHRLVSRCFPSLETKTVDLLPSGQAICVRRRPVSENISHWPHVIDHNGLLRPLPPCRCRRGNGGKRTRTIQVRPFWRVYPLCHTVHLQLASFAPGYSTVDLVATVGGATMYLIGRHQQKQPRKGQQHVAFTLQKTNVELTTALQTLSRQLGCSMKDISSAGMPTIWNAARIAAEGCSAYCCRILSH